MRGMAPQSGVARASDGLASEIAQLQAAIDRHSAAANRRLRHHPSALEDGYPRWGRTDHAELCRQLTALNDYVARAWAGERDEVMLRAELATLLPFARTLSADAEQWRSGLDDGLRQIERLEAAARAERERLAAQREVLMRRRDALQFGINDAAERLERDNGADCRKTIPVHVLGEGATVCSVSARIPRRGFRSEKRWLVTLNESRDEVVIKRG